MEYLSLPVHLITDQVIRRFQQKYWRKSIDKCWIWQSSHTGANKGNRRAPIFKIDGINYVATRIAYYLHYGIDPESKCVCHDCFPNKDNSSCVNPEHLWLGTMSENILDAFYKGVQPSFGNRKMSDDDVREARNLFYNQGWSIKDLMDRYNLKYGAMNKLINYQTFIHLID